MKIWVIKNERYPKKSLSVRNFLDKEIEDNVLNEILEVVKYSPTAKNGQPQRVYVLRGKENIDKISSVCKCIFGAKVVLLFCYNKNEVWRNRYIKDKDSGILDTAICLDEVMLKALSLGVGSCIVGYYNPNDIKELFNLGEEIELVSLLVMGYPDKSVEPLHLHYESKDLSELVKEL